MAFSSFVKMKEDLVILVDENDNVTGHAGKTDAHIKGLLHRAVSVFIFNSRGDWLMQKRADGKYHSGGLWSNTCCSHPLPGETVTDAAGRRLMEEMGMECELNKLFTFIYREEFGNGLTEHELDHVFAGISDSLPAINPDEASEYKYLNFCELKTDVERFPDNYTVWFRKIFRQVNSTFSAV
jgi:isopentenyl-diphosphate Delta-isomerase